MKYNFLFFLPLSNSIVCAAHKSFTSSFPSPSPIYSFNNLSYPLLSFKIHLNFSSSLFDSPNFSTLTVKEIADQCVITMGSKLGNSGNKFSSSLSDLLYDASTKEENKKSVGIWLILWLWQISLEILRLWKLQKLKSWNSSGTEEEELGDFWVEFTGRWEGELLYWIYDPKFCESIWLKTWSGQLMFRVKRIN